MPETDEDRTDDVEAGEPAALADDAVEAVVVEEPEPEPTPAPAPRPRTAERTAPSRPGWMWPVIGVLGLAVLLLAVVAARQTAAGNAEKRDRQQVTEVAGRMGAAFTTYDYRSFDLTRDRVVALATGGFRKEYQEAADALKEQITQTKASSQGEVKQVYVADVDEGRAEAIVVVDLTAQGLAGTRQTLANYIELSLVKVEGKWKVDQITNLNLGLLRQGGGGIGGASPTTTAAPGAPSAP